MLIYVYKSLCVSVYCSTLWRLVILTMPLKSLTHNILTEKQAQAFAANFQESLEDKFFQYYMKVQTFKP